MVSCRDDEQLAKKKKRKTILINTIEDLDESKTKILCHNRLQGKRKFFFVVYFLKASLNLSNLVIVCR